MYWSKKDLEAEDRVYRLNLINSIIGVKPVNLIGSEYHKQSNLAIFSSLVHLGSEPAAVAMVLRPSDVVPRHTLKNIRETKVYTFNMVCLPYLKKAHYTSTKLPRKESEFTACGFTPFYLEDFPAPFVKESPVKVGLRFLEEIHIECTQTSLVIGSIEHLVIEEEAISEEGYINFEYLQTGGVGGLNCYYSLKKHAEYPYARLSEFRQIQKELQKKI